MIRWLAMLTVCAALGALTGCAGYHLGAPSGLKAGAQSIQIAPFANKTLEPRVSDYVMNSLRQRIMQNGTYKVATHDDGDVILNGEITGFERTALSVQPTDVLTVLDYQVTLTAHVTVRDRRTDKVILDKVVQGHTLLRTGADLPSAERQAVPLLTDDLARKVARLLADGTW
jgi:hypothetical protein